MVRIDGGAVMKDTLAAHFAELRALPAGWNGYNSAPIRDDVIDWAANLADVLMTLGMPPPFLCPTSDGGLQLEWHTRGVDLEIMIGEPGQAWIEAEKARR
jgi:hypothetical protein